MFVRDIYRSESIDEIEIKFLGQYGRRGEKRAPRRKPTQEEIRRNNQRNREKYVRRLIQLNFKEGDWWLTFTAKKGAFTTTAQLVDACRKLRRKLRRIYKKLGEEFKYIYRLEIGERGGLHFHILINQIDGLSLEQIKEIWRACGGWSVNIQPTYQDGGYKDLAEYICKEPPAEYKGQISMSHYEIETLCRYQPSRNLKKPERERKIFRRRTVEKMIRDGIKPTEGYVLDKDSIEIGVNPYTGWSYINYRQYKVRRE